MNTVEKARKLVSLSMKRWVKLAPIGEWSEDTRNPFVRASEYMREVDRQLVLLSTRGFVPMQKKRGPKPKKLYEGQIVAIREAKQYQYRPVLDPNDFEGLSVVSVNGTNVLVRTRSDRMAVLPKAHVA